MGKSIKASLWAPASLTPQRQHASHDCAVACIATLTGEGYYDVAALTGGASDGLTDKVIRKVLRRLGFIGRYTTRWPLGATGILTLYHTGGTHCVVLWRGLTYDPENGKWYAVPSGALRDGGLPAGRIGRLLLLTRLEEA